MSEKHKATLITCLIITLLAIALVWLGAKQHTRTLENQIKAAEAELQASIATMETFSFTPYRQRLKNVLATRPHLIEAFATRDRSRFLERALPVYASLQEENPFIKNMHFHLPDGRTFVRLHKPDFYGDDLTQIRPMITRVHQTRSPLSGFEIGHYGPFFRVVEPVFHLGEYIGAAEIGILPSQILTLLENQKDLSVTTYFTREAFEKTTLFDKSHLRLLDNLQILSQGKDIFSRLPDNISLSHATQRLTIGPRSYILHCRPFFHDFKGQSIGGLLVLQDITVSRDQQQAFLLKSFLFSAILLILTLAVVSFYFNRVMGALLREIAERKKSEQALYASEQRFRFLVHDLPQIAVQGYDKNRKVVLWNRGSELIYGYSEAEALGKQLEDLIIPAPMRPQVIQAFNNWLAFDIPIPASELSLRNKEGDPVHVFSSHALTHSRDGEPELYCIDVDIKDLKTALAKQRIMEDRLHRAQKMETIGLMAGGVAHDLNNILSGIVSYPELLLMQLPEESTLRKPLETIKESGTRAAAVVSDLLTVARGVAKTTEVADPQKFINAYLESPEYLELCRRYPHIRIITQLEAGPEFIRCSSVHVMKVITNLINNAAEAVHDRGAITIRTSMVEMDDFRAMEHDIAPGPYYLLAICDDGPGIAAEDLPRIFEPFFTKKIMGRSGTGLGLTVVWNTMRDHGGTVVAESSEKGSFFKLFFPVCNEERSPAAEPPQPTEAQGNGERILVVDDEPQQRLIATKALEIMGYQPCTACSGEEAVEYLRHHQVDLVILDMIMDPGINGRETYARIRQFRPEQKAIIASGFSHSTEVEAALAMGAGQYLKKPYTIGQLGAAIKRELHRKIKG